MSLPFSDGTTALADYAMKKVPANSGAETRCLNILFSARNSRLFRDLLLSREHSSDHLASAYLCRSNQSAQSVE